MSVVHAGRYSLGTGLDCLLYYVSKPTSYACEWACLPLQVCMPAGIPWVLASTLLLYYVSKPTSYACEWACLPLQVCMPAGIPWVLASTLLLYYVSKPTSYACEWACLPLQVCMPAGIPWVLASTRLLYYVSKPTSYACGWACLPLQVCMRPGAAEGTEVTKVSDRLEGVTVRHMPGLTKRYKGRDKARKKSPTCYRERDWRPITYFSKEMP